MCSQRAGVEDRPDSVQAAPKHTHTHSCSILHGVFTMRAVRTEQMKCLFLDPSTEGPKQLRQTLHGGSHLHARREETRAIKVLLGKYSSSTLNAEARISGPQSMDARQRSGELLDGRQACAMKSERSSSTPPRMYLQQPARTRNQDVLFESRNQEVQSRNQD